jgi:pyruvate kinase
MYNRENLNINRLVKTKIVCTLGPVSTNEEMLEKMILAGMDIVRLNFSHGSHEDHTKVFELVRRLGEKYGNQISLVCDIQGPKIRTGIMKEPFYLKNGDIIDVTPQEVVGTPELIQIRYQTMLKDLNEGDFIFINDGIIRLRVTGKTDTALHCVCEAGGLISDKKGCNIPSGNISLNVITPKDEKDLELIAKLNPEWVASSFIGTADDVKKVKDMLKSFGNDQIKVISKIERPVALENIDSIIEISDGLMVARGDLGVEIPTWEVPVAQKMMCKKCNAAGKPVIVATQMLESMISCPRPTRAEANDVYNAVIDGADAVMLSGESAVGKYPCEAIVVMDNIVDQAERKLSRNDPSLFISQHLGMTESCGLAAFQICEFFKTLGWTGKICVHSNPPSSYVTRMVSKFRPTMDVLAFSSDRRTALENNLLFGVRSIFSEKLDNFQNIEDRFLASIKLGLGMKLLEKQDHVLCVARSLNGKHTGTVTCVYSIENMFDKINTIQM